MRFALLLIVVVSIGGILFATQPSNLEAVEFAIPFTESVIVGYKLWTVLGAFALGLLLGYLAALPGAFGASRRAKKAEKQLAKIGGAVADKADDITAEARAAAATAVSPTAREHASDAAADAAEMQRLADEVARRTTDVTGK